MRKQGYLRDNNVLFYKFDCVFYQLLIKNLLIKIFFIDKNIINAASNLIKELEDDFSPTYFICIFA